MRASPSSIAARTRSQVSIKALEVAEEKEAIAQYGSSDSGATLGDILGTALKRKGEEDEKANEGVNRSPLLARAGERDRLRWKRLRLALLRRVLVHLPEARFARHLPRQRGEGASEKDAPCRLMPT